MKQNGLKNHFFLLMKMVYVLLVVAGAMIQSDVENVKLSHYLICGACFFAGTIMFQTAGNRRIAAFLFEILVVIVSYCIKFDYASYLGLVVLSDFVLLVGLPVFFCLLQPVLILCLSYRIGDASFPLLVVSIAVGAVYYQEYEVIAGYQRETAINTAQEYLLKQNIAQARKQHEQQMKQSRLRYENMMLTQKSEISQALHDKLGHSINGSLYQLEACKAIMETNPEESRRILQTVIDHLRGSMDEIRLILRREKPEKSKMSIIQMEALCEECRTKYRLAANLTVKGDVKQVRDGLWEILLDNTYEAVSNALKYSKCQSIEIQIFILNEVLRCTIQDDGIGCENIQDGMGLSGMKQRVRNMGGIIDIDAQNGFKINMILPLKDKKVG